MTAFNSYLKRNTHYARIGAPIKLNTHYTSTHVYSITRFLSAHHAVNSSGHIELIRRVVAARFTASALPNLAPFEPLILIFGVRAACPAHRVQCALWNPKEHDKSQGVTTCEEQTCIWRLRKWLHREGLLSSQVPGIYASPRPYGGARFSLTVARAHKLAPVLNLHGFDKARQRARVC